jgi:hypothetical protein
MPQLGLHVTGIGVSGRAYDVEVFDADMATNVAWRARATARGVYEVEVNRHHPAFNSSSLQIRDAVLAEAAHYIASEEAAAVGPREGVAYSDVLVALRSRFVTSDSLDAGQLRSEVDELRRHLAARVSAGLGEQPQHKLLQALPPEDIRAIELAQARGPASAAPTEYLDIRHFAHLLDLCPALLFEAGCFDRDWTPATLASDAQSLEEHRCQLVREISMPMRQLAGFSRQATSTPDATQPYLALTRACVNRVREYVGEKPAVA